MNFVRIICNFLVYFYLGPIFIFHIDIVYEYILFSVVLLKINLLDLLRPTY